MSNPFASPPSFDADYGLLSSSPWTLRQHFASAASSTLSPNESVDGAPHLDAIIRQTSPYYADDASAIFDTTFGDSGIALAGAFERDRHDSEQSATSMCSLQTYTDSLVDTFGSLALTTNADCNNNAIAPLQHVWSSPLDAFQEQPPPPPTASPSSTIDITTPTTPFCVRINGRREFGPPADWSGPAPPIDAELFVKHIPDTMTPERFYAIFARYGRIYRIRLMVHYNDLNRGFGYVFYASVEEARRAMYVLPEMYVVPAVRLEVLRSYHKCRLFVSHVPKRIAPAEVRSELEQFFREVGAVTVHDLPNGGNRGFAYLDFPNHDAAIRAKQQASTGRVCLFGVDLHVIWADPLRDRVLAPPLALQKAAAVSFGGRRRVVRGDFRGAGTYEKAGELRTVMVRNLEVGMTEVELFELVAGMVPAEEVTKFWPNGEGIYVEMRTRALAEVLLGRLNGWTTGGGRELKVHLMYPPKM